MSNFGHIKKFRSQKAKDLKRNHTSAFLVLDTIAENAKRKKDEGHHLLELGEAIITSEECGVTRHQFPTALKYLEIQGIIEIIHRGRKDKGSSFLKRSGIKTESTDDSIGIKTGINGTIVKLINSEYYDINIEDGRNQNGNQNGINCRKKPAQRRNKEIRNKEELHIEKYKKEKIQPIEQIPPNAENQPADAGSIPSEIIAVNQDFVKEDLQEPLQGTSDNIHSVYSQELMTKNRLEDSIEKSNKKAQISDKVKRYKNIEISEEEHLDLINFVEEKKRYAEKGEGASFLEICYDKLSQWKKDATKQQLKKYTDARRIKHWTAMAVKKSLLEDEEIKLKERRLKGYSNPTANASINKFANDDFEVIEERKQKANKIIKENWGKFRLEMRPQPMPEFVRFNNDKLYYKDKKFDQLLEHFIRKAKV